MNRSLDGQPELQLPHQPTKEQVNAIVSFFLNSPIARWPDGGVFRLVVALNAIGIPTDNSCEGTNPGHRTPRSGPISFPTIDLTEDQEPWDVFAEVAGVPVPPEAEARRLLTRLLEEYYNCNNQNHFRLRLTAKGTSPVLSAFSTCLFPKQFDHNDHGMAVAELNRFADWLEKRYFPEGYGFDQALHDALPQAEADEEFVDPQYSQWRQHPDICEAIVVEMQTKASRVFTAARVRQLLANLAS